MFKQILGEPENAASFLAGNLPGEILSHLDLNTLQVLQVSFIDAQFIQSEADLLFSVTIADRPGFVYFLFEHQSSPDAFMMLRLLGYMVRVWKRYQRQSTSCDRLPVIVPMVLFHGPRGWECPSTFHALMDIPTETFVSDTPDFSCRLYDLSAFGKDQLAGNAIVRVLGDLLGAFGQPDFQERLARALTTLKELANAPGFARYLEILFRYVLQVFNIPKADLGQLVIQALTPEAKELLMTTYEQLIHEGKQIGIQEGKQIGIHEGSNLVLGQLIAKKFKQDLGELKPLLDDFALHRQEELIEKILLSSSLEELIDWMKSVAHN